MSKIRVALIDDHPLVLQGFKVTLESIEGFLVVGTAANGEDGMALVLKEEPDVVLMDIMLPGSSGLEVMRQLKEKLPNLHVILITASDSDLYLVEALRYGASGYLSKDASKALIEFAVRGAVQEGITLSALLVNKAFGAISKAAVNLQTPGSGRKGPSMVELTPREIDVLRLIAQGKTDSAISKELSMSEEAVKRQVQALRQSLGTRDRISTAIQGIRLGLIE